MAIGVTVNYTIEDLDFHNNNVQIKYLLDNDEAPLSKRYLEVYNLSDIYSVQGTIQKRMTLFFCFHH